MASSHRFDSVEHFTAGTVGPKGQRTFFMQFGVSGTMVTLKVEKQQVAALAEYLDELMADVETPTYDSVPLALDLIEPIEAEWTVGSLGAAYHAERDRFMVIAEEFLDEDDEEEPGTAQIALTRGQVVAFVERSRQAVSSVAHLATTAAGRLTMTMAGARASTKQWQHSRGVPAVSDDPFRDRPPIADDDAIAVLADGEIDILGRMPWSSNGTFLCDVALDGTELQGIYKPLETEQPLWDFPEGLYQREVASYRLSRHLGWDLVPPTILRDGPLGIGSFQLAIPARFDEHFFSLVEDERHTEAFQRLCVFDVMTNQTDRKGGHCLVDGQHHIWAIDNGLSFHQEFKLRTVIWNWSGEYIPKNILDEVQTFLEDGLPDALTELLNPFEIDACLTRSRALVREGTFPVDHTGRRHPWPLV